MRRDSRLLTKNTPTVRHISCAGIFAAQREVEQVAGLPAIQIILVHEQGGCISKTIFAQRVARLNGKSFAIEQKRHKREFHGVSSFLIVCDYLSDIERIHRLYDKITRSVPGVRCALEIPKTLDADVFMRFS